MYAQNPFDTGGYPIFTNLSYICVTFIRDYRGKVSTDLQKSLQMCCIYPLMQTHLCTMNLWMKQYKQRI